MTTKVRHFPEAKMDVRPFLESSYLLPRHTCCYDAHELLFPPSSQVSVPIGKEDGVEYVAICRSIEQWNIDVDGIAGTGIVPLVFVEFCPFCGERLPESEKETG